MDDKYIVKINQVEYHSYFSVCRDYNIDLRDFLLFKSQNPEITQLELLSHFLGKVKLNLEDGSIMVD